MTVRKRKVEKYGKRGLFKSRNDLDGGTETRFSALEQLFEKKCSSLRILYQSRILRTISQTLNPN